MSNIYTEHARLYFRPGTTITPAKVEALIEKVLDERGSYWVPVWYELSLPSHLDLQYGSGKGASIENLEKDDLDLFEWVWIRFADEGADEDKIYAWNPALGEDAGYAGRDARRVCRYAFDEVRAVLQEKRSRLWLPEGLSWQKCAEGFRTRCSGSYAALNERKDMEIGPRVRLSAHRRTPGGFPTPSTPNHDEGSLSSLEGPQHLTELLEREQEAIRGLDLLYAGRVVHRVEWRPRHPELPNEREWMHLCADHWDNCVDPQFVASRFPSTEF